MWIIPYTRTSFQQTNRSVTTFQILTVGGTALWQEDNSLNVIQDVLEPNGLILSGKPVKWKDAWLCPIDSSKTSMSDFYQWKELPLEDRETFCWRTFYLMGHATGSWLPVPEKERMGSIRCHELLAQLSAV